MALIWQWKARHSFKKRFGKNCWSIALTSTFCGCFRRSSFDSGKSLEFLTKFAIVLERGGQVRDEILLADSESGSTHTADGLGCNEVKMEAAITTLSLKRDLLTGTEWTPAQLRDFFRLASDMKAHPDRYRTALAGSVFVLIFEKPSLRTRVTFEVGIANLGGSSIFLDHTATRLHEREPIRDIAKNLERWVQGVIARVFDQESLEELAKNANVPVINALSDRFHPCQALADFFTLEERFGGLRGLKFAYVGDGNNMCHSLLVAGARCGRTFASPRPPVTSRTRPSSPKRSEWPVKRVAKSKFSARPRKL